MSDKSSKELASPTCWCGGPKGIIAPPCKYKAGKSWDNKKQTKNEPLDDDDETNDKKKSN